MSSIVALSDNLRTWERLRIHGQPGVKSEFPTSQGYEITPRLKRK